MREKKPGARRVITDRHRGAGTVLAIALERGTTITTSLRDPQEKTSTASNDNLNQFLATPLSLVHLPAGRSQEDPPQPPIGSVSNAR
jgi:hypothetical protein